MVATMVKILPEFQDCINPLELQKLIKLAILFIKYSKSNPLDKKSVKKINERIIKPRSPNSLLFHGGQSILFAWKVQLHSKDFPLIVIKPYHRNNLTQIVTHIISTRLFKRVIGNQEFDINLGKGYHVKPMEILAIQMLEMNEHVYPMVFQQAARGLTFSELEMRPLPSLTEIIQFCAKHGFVMDPYLSNWYVDHEEAALEYVDLLFYNKLGEHRSEIDQLINFFKEDAPIKV